MRAGDWGRVLVAPWLAWPDIVRSKRDGSVLYLLVAGEALLAAPERSARLLWGLARRGPTMLPSLVKLAANQIIPAILFAGVLALGLRLKRRRAEGFDTGHYLGFAPFAYVPHVLVTALFFAAWSLGATPASELSISDTHGRIWLLVAWAPVGVSCASLLRVLRAPNVEPLVSAAGELWLKSVAVGVAFGVALFVVVAAERVSNQPGRFRPVGRGDVVESFAIEPLAGVGQATIAFPRPRPVVLDFWATWCGPCVAALPDWQALSSSTAADFFSINTEPEARVNVDKFLHDNNYTFPVFIAAGLDDRLGVDTLPTTVVLDRFGAVREYFVGVTSKARLERAVEAATRR